MHDFRGATVEDLDLPPAFSINPETPLEHALELSFERSYSYLPVISSRSRSLLGYLSAEQLQKTFNSPNPPRPKTGDREAGLSTAAPVRSFMRKFPKKQAFQKITPDTPLEELEQFFDSGHDFAVITDTDRRFVLAVAVPEDLQNFVKRRPSISLADD
ncbi:hypothetical protein V1525DRAFT_403641 [Lipomyces kononenkoae]|uniref:Uncharacterized protein n=1 Tax=Lipomyces kononenkoae TaxID=34357 RepID=A0ACC3T127_LIPKO